MQHQSLVAQRDKTGQHSEKSYIRPESLGLMYQVPGGLSRGLPNLPDWPLFWLAPSITGILNNGT